MAGTVRVETAQAIPPLGDAYEVPCFFLDDGDPVVLEPLGARPSQLG